MEGFLHKGHYVYIDNRYTSIEVCNVLNNTTTDVVGTLRRDCKGLPDAVVKKKLKHRQLFNMNMKRTLKGHIGKIRGMSLW